MSDPEIRFDEQFDVVVVGCGFAGANAAIAAHDSGAKVVILEKMPDPGGISICSGGGLRVASDAEQALEYLRRTNAETAPDELLQTLADGMVNLPERVKELAAVSSAEVVYRDAPGIYPFDGRDCFGFVNIAEVPQFEPEREFAHARSLGSGILLFKVLMDNLRRRGIELRLNAPVERLICSSPADANGSDHGLLGVGGVAYSAETGTRRIAAKRGVILACGGFEAAPEMQKQYWQGVPVFSTSFLGNTGDGIRMAQAVGADLWHMWHYHGTYGFKLPDSPIGIRTKRLPDWYPDAPQIAEPEAAQDTQEEGDSFSNILSDSRAVPMPWILVDQDGRRFMNEYEPYMQDTGHRGLDRYQPESQRFPRIPCWMVTDADGVARFRLGQPLYNDRSLSLEWSDDNRAEIEAGILRKADSVSELAELIKVESATLEGTIAAWNDACASRLDASYARPPSSMLSIDKGPYYAVETWPLVSNTQGGPRHDAEQRVLNPFGEAIPGLYAAGELGSVFGHLYLSGGNLAECFVGGRIAGEQAAGRIEN